MTTSSRINSSSVHTYILVCSTLCVILQGFVDPKCNKNLHEEAHTLRDQWFYLLHTILSRPYAHLGPSAHPIHYVPSAHTAPSVPSAHLTHSICPAILHPVQSASYTFFVIGCSLNSIQIVISIRPLYCRHTLLKVPNASLYHMPKILCTPKINERLSPNKPIAVSTRPLKIST